MRVLATHDQHGRIKSVVVVGQNVPTTLHRLVKDSEAYCTEIDVSELDGLDPGGLEMGQHIERLKQNYHLDLGALRPTLKRSSKEQ